MAFFDAQAASETEDGIRLDPTNPVQQSVDQVPEENASAVQEANNDTQTTAPPTETQA